MRKIDLNYLKNSKGKQGVTNQYHKEKQNMLRIAPAM
jgi:hypothetical protein